MLPAPGKPTPVATCKSCGWEFYVSAGFGGLGWHTLPAKCRCKRHYLIVIHVTLQTGRLHVRNAGLRSVRVAGEAGIRRALLDEPIAGMSAHDVEMIVAVAALLARGGSVEAA